MTLRNTNSDKRLRLFARLRGLGGLAGAFALLLLGLGPLGSRAGAWSYGVGLALVGLAGLLAILGAIGAGLGLAFGRAPARWPQAVPPALVILLGLGVLWAIWQVVQSGAPPIHDITTDPDDPPAFAAALPARRAEQAATEAYAGASVARRQQAAYPDIAPVLLALPPERAFALALETAKAMPGWRITASDPGTGRIEASQASFWFGFVDDIVIRVAGAGAGSRVDMRSLSRQGIGDLGVNARRVRAYMAALRRAAG